MTLVTTIEIDEKLNAKPFSGGGLEIQKIALVKDHIDWGEVGTTQETLLTDYFQIRNTSGKTIYIGGVFPTQPQNFYGAFSQSDVSVGQDIFSDGVVGFEHSIQTSVYKLLPGASIALKVSGAGPNTVTWWGITLDIFKKIPEGEKRWTLTINGYDSSTG